MAVIVAEKLERGTAKAETGQVPGKREMLTLPLVGLQLSVPLTVTLEVPCVMVKLLDVVESVHVTAYAGERKAAPIIVTARIERTAMPTNLNL